MEGQEIEFVKAYLVHKISDFGEVFFGVIEPWNNGSAKDKPCVISGVCESADIIEDALISNSCIGLGH